MPFELRTGAQRCLEQFSVLIGVSKELGHISNVLDDDYGTSMIEEQNARFRIWVNDIGVFADGQDSLDCRLYNNQIAQKAIGNFFVSLADAVHRATISLRSNTTSEVSRRVDDLAKEDENLADLHSDDSASSIVSSSFQGTETNSVQDGVASEDAAENLLIQSSLSNIEKAIDRLYRLSFMICQISKSSSEDETPWLAKEENNSACRNEMTHYFENQNRDTVRLTLRHQENIGTSGISVGSARHMVDCCFPDAPEFLRAKLSDDIVFRRRRILYRHAETESDQSTTFIAKPSSSTAVELPCPPKTIAGCQEFECPYCCKKLPVKESEDFHWRRHVLGDLEPYTCLFQGCPDGAALFKDNAAWMAHLEGHRSRWRCTSKAHSATLFISEDEYFEHMRNQHAKSFTDSQLPLLANQRRVTTTMIFPQCPLCSYVPNEAEMRDSSDMSRAQKNRLVSKRILEHLGAHLVFLALQALPLKEQVEDRPETYSKPGEADNSGVQTEPSSRPPSYKSEDKRYLIRTWNHYDLQKATLRNPMDDYPYVEYLLDADDPFNEGVRIFMTYKQEFVSPSTQAVLRFCHGVSRQHMLASCKSTAWLDDRSRPPVCDPAQNVSPCDTKIVLYDSDYTNPSLMGPESIVALDSDAVAESRMDESAGAPHQRMSVTHLPRTYGEPLKPRELYHHLREKCFDHGVLEDADRRLIYIADPDPCYILVLTVTARKYQQRAVVELLERFIARRISLGVSISTSGYRVFQLNLHLSCFLLRETPPEDLSRREGEDKYSEWMDLSFLIEDAGKETISMHLAHFSLTICGTDNSHWTAFALETKNFNFDPGDQDFPSGLRYDKISMGQLDADQPLWDPRAYFLNICQIRANHMLEEAEQLVVTIEEYFMRQKSSYTVKRNKNDVCIWNEHMRLLMDHLDCNFSDAIGSWGRFLSERGDIEYFLDTHQDFPPDTRAHIIKLLVSLNRTFGDMERLWRDLQRIKEGCQKLQKDLDLARTQQSSQTGEVAITIISPIAIVSSLFAIPQSVLPYERTFLSFITTAMLFMLFLRALLMIRERWHWRWPDKPFRRARAVCRGGERITRRKSTYENFT